MHIKIVVITCGMTIASLSAAIPLPPAPSVSQSSGGNSCSDREVLQLVTNIKHLPILSSFISDRSGDINDAGSRITSYQLSIRAAQAQINYQVNLINDLTMNKIPALTKEIEALNTQMQQQATLSADALCNAQAVSLMVGPLSTVIATERPDGKGGMTTAQYNNLLCASEKIARCINPNTKLNTNYCAKISDADDLKKNILEGYTQRQDALKNTSTLKWYPVATVKKILEMANRTLPNAEKIIRAAQESVASIKKTIMTRIEQRKNFVDEIAKSKALIAQLQENISQYKAKIEAQQDVIATNRQAIDSAKAVIEDLQNKIKVPDAIYSRCPQYLQSILA